MRTSKGNILLGTAVISLLASLISGCGPGRKVTYLHDNRVQAALTLPSEVPGIDTFSVSTIKAKRDTFKVRDLDGREILIMKAVKDEDGEMVAHDVIDAAVVTARFRNVAERHGKVDIQFNITVPQSMQDSKWQLRFHPRMYIMEDSLALESVIITGEDYRKAQLKGYQQYDRFISGIIQDSTKLINLHQLEIWISRNIPALYAFKTDSTAVSDEQFSSVFGVTEQQAIEHYTDKLARGINAWKRSRMDKMYRRYVKVPIATDGIRLDTVLRSYNGDFIYCYTQTIHTRPKLRSVDIVLSGEIFESDRQIYTIPQSDPLTFYISSLSSFVDPTERYLTRVIERRVEANTACYVDFEQGKAEVRERWSNNYEEIRRIKDNIAQLLENTTFDLDSIVVKASASPEGSWKSNEQLSQRRSKAIADYMDAYIRHYQDSLDREKGFSVDENGRIVREDRMQIRFLARSIPENWDMLDAIVEKDSLMQGEWLESYRELRKIRNADEREKAMSSTPWYRHAREDLYPRVRTVRFDFHLHRKGMVQDTVHTTELDSVYMEGVQAIRDRDYQRAISLLRPYNDFNTAIAYCSLDYNASAMAILQGLERTAQVNYMLAVLHSREGEDEKAVQCYLHAIAQEPTYRFRGNLDPEISALIKRYGLDAQEEEDDLSDYGF